MCYTSLTAASAEIEGRSYGGGILNIEPSEMQRLLVPSELRPGLPVKEIDLMIRQRDLCRVLNVNDRLVLHDGLGLSTKDIDSLRNIWNTMRERRQSRRKSNRNNTV
jgi:adenine-specific DNA methylase